LRTLLRIMTNALLAICIAMLIHVLPILAVPNLGQSVMRVSFVRHQL